MREDCTSSRKGGHHPGEKGLGEGGGRGGTQRDNTGSRCEALARGQSPQVSDRQEDGVRWTAGRALESASLTSGVRSGGFFFSACLAPGSTGEFMAAAPAPVLPSLPLAVHETAHSP